MAKGGKFVRRLQAFLAFLGVVGLIIVYSLITGWNPLPAALDKLSSLSEPAPAWQTSVGDQPQTAVASARTVLIASRATVEAHRLSNGDRLWSREVAWVGFAGSGNDVVIAGRTSRAHGFDAVDPDTGAVRWSDNSATGAWAYTDLVVSIACPDAASCKLTARSPESGSVRWTAALPGDARNLVGADPALAEPRPFPAAVASARPAPALFGFPVGDQVQVVASANGRRLHAYPVAKDTRVVVSGRRVVVATVQYRTGGCRYSADGRDPDGDRRVWHLDGYDLKTASGTGCDQREDPIGGGGLLDATDPDGHEVLLDGATGRRAYQPPAGGTVLATDGETVLIRTGDGQTVREARIGGSTVWSRVVDRSVHVALAPDVVLFTDSEADHLLAVSGQGGTRVDASSGATALGYASNGLLIHIGLRVGLLTYR